jgi:hypothetical protein
MDRETALRHTRHGALLWLAMGGINGLAVVYAMLADVTEQPLADFDDPWALVLVPLFVALAFGVYRKSRLAAIGGLGIFVLDKVATGLDGGISPNGIVGAFAILTIYIHVQAIRGCFAYHRLAREEDPNYKVGSRWTLALGGLSVLLGVVVGVFAVLSAIGLITSGEVDEGAQLSERTIEALREAGGVRPDDEIAFFFAENPFTLLHGGSILVSDRVIGYERRCDDQLVVEAIYYEEIVDIELRDQGGQDDYAVYEVLTRDPDRSLILLLPPEEEGGHRFVDALRSRIVKPEPRHNVARLRRDAGAIPSLLRYFPSVNAS